MFNLQTNSGLVLSKESLLGLLIDKSKILGEAIIKDISRLLPDEEDLGTDLAKKIMKEIEEMNAEWEPKVGMDQAAYEEALTEIEEVVAVANRVEEEVEKWQRSIWLKKTPTFLKDCILF